MVPKHEPNILEAHYRLLNNMINEATESATTTTTRIVFHKTVPAYLLDIIRACKKTVRDIKKLKLRDDPTLATMKAHYNKLTRIIKNKFKA